MSIYLRCIGLMLALGFIHPWAHADDRPFKKVPAFEFSDAFYLANGVNPSNLTDRLDGSLDDRSSLQASPHQDFKDVRIHEITGGFDHSGDVLYYTVNAKVFIEDFTDDPEGAEALAIANSFRAFIFPKKDGGLPLSPAPPNRRQDNVFDTRNGYFSNNPLGLWILTFVSWDGANVNDGTCQDMASDLREENGIDLDGTPVIKTVSDLENLEEEGCVQFRTRNRNGSQGFPWVV